MRVQTFYIAIIGFILGVGINSFVHIKFWPAIVIFSVCACVFVAVFFVRQKAGPIFLAALLIFSVSIGLARHAYSIFETKNAQFEDSVGTKIDIEGIVVEEPDVREASTRLTVRLITLEAGATPATSAKEKILISTDLFAEFSYGDTLAISGTLEKPENFETDTGREFNYVAYLAKDGIAYQMFRPQIEIVSRGGGNFFKRTLLRVKKSFVENLEMAIPQPHSALAAGILLGAKHSLGKELEDKFRQTGLVHIVVLSGYNVTIVADFIMRMLGFLPRRARAIAGLCGIAAFALLTGAGATVVRAAIMSCLVIIARVTGRTSDILRALFLAAALMIFWNPLILISDPSFQLSCMATFALIALTPHIESRMQFIPEKFGLRAVLSSTLSTQIFLLPMLIYMTGIVSLVGLATNLLVPPIIPAAMLASFLSGLVGFLFGFISILFGYGAFILLYCITSIVEIFSALPFAYIAAPRISAWLVVCAYVFFIVLLRKSFSQSHPS